MTTSIGLVQPAAHPLTTLDMEAQQVAEPRRYNPYVTALKAGGLALCGAGAVIATGLLASIDHAASVGTRRLQESDCTPEQWDGVDKAKKALLYSGIGSAAAIGVTAISALLVCRSGPENRDAFCCLSSSVIFAGLMSTMASGLAYGAMKNKCDTGIAG